MALSMDEQRILDQIERGLASADPALATRMSSFGAPRRITTMRMRRLRLVASLMTLLVIASVSVVVYALVPFRTVADRHAGSKPSTSPVHPAMTTPSHPAAQSPAGPLVSGGQSRAGDRVSRGHSPGQLSARERHGRPGAQRPRGQFGQPGRASASPEHARPVGPAIGQAGQFSRQNCRRYCSSPSRFFLACWNSSLSGSTPRSNISSYSRMTSRRLRA